MEPMNTWFVFIGAGLGGVLRFGVNTWTLRAFGPSFPYGTLLVNVTGSALMGMLAGYLMARGDLSSGWRLFLATGLLGGFTTFSAFSLDVLQLIERSDWMLAAAYIAGSIVLSIAALAAGLWAVRAWVS